MITPLKAIRRYCLWCSNNSAMEVRLCSVEACPLYALRFGRGIRGKGISTLRAIRKKCLGCGQGTAFDVKNCTFADCTLHSYRFGKNPALKGKMRGKPFTKGDPRLSATSTHRNSEKNIGLNEALTADLSISGDGLPHEVRVER